MITLFESMEVKLGGITFFACGKLISAEKVTTNQREYIKIKVSISGRRATMLCFNTKPHTMAAIEMGIDDYCFIRGYVNLSLGFFLSVCNITLIELDKVGSPLREDAILKAIYDEKPFKRMDNICRNARTACEREDS